MFNSKPYPGRLIVMEGVDGSGKSTQLYHLQRALEARAHRVRLVREPGGTALGEALRPVLLSQREEGLDPWAELMLFMAARAQLCEQVLRPALEAGEVVLCDRFTDSTLAYQGYGRGLPLKTLHHLNEQVTRGLRADVTFVFDLPEAERQHRLARRAERLANTGGREADRIEAETLAFQQRVARGYLSLLRQGQGRVKVRAERSIPSIHQFIIDFLTHKEVL